MAFLFGRKRQTAADLVRATGELLQRLTNEEKGQQTGKVPTNT